MEKRTRVIVVCFALIAVGFVPTATADSSESSGTAFGPCDGGSIVEDACRAFLSENCHDVRDPAMEEICETIRTTPEIDPQGSWADFNCKGTAVKTNVQSTTTQAQLSDPKGIASFSVGTTTSSHDLDWNYECSGEIRAWAVGKNGFSREVEVVLGVLTKMCPYSGLPGDTGCTTPEITEKIASSPSTGTTKEGDSFPEKVTIHLEVPIEGYNRGVTAFGELPELTVYDDTLATLTRETIIDWSMVDGPGGDDDWNPLGPILPPPGETPDIPGLGDLPDLPGICDLGLCRDPSPSDPPPSPPDEDKTPSRPGKCDFSILCYDLNLPEFREIDLPDRPDRPGELELEIIDINRGKLSPSFA